MPDKEVAEIDMEHAHRFRLRLPTDVPNENKCDFALYCYNMHKRKTWKDDDLSEYFADDFRLYTSEDFKLHNTEIRRDLRDLLRNRDVYVPKGTKYSYCSFALPSSTR